MEFDDVSDNDIGENLMDDAAVENAVTQILTAVGEDPQREGLQFTPRRVARMYHELLGGYTMDPKALINGALFDVKYDEMVLVRDIEFYSMCEHHMLSLIHISEPTRPY